MNSPKNKEEKIRLNAAWDGWSEEDSQLMDSWIGQEKNRCGRMRENLSLDDYDGRNHDPWEED